MVKLFVGNLADSIDSHRLKNFFLQHVNVQECDVLKHFAFVHVATEEDATMVIEKFNKAMLEGREIHIERSTSRLRKEPGMSDKCFTCGDDDHKTPQCPQEQGNSRKTKRPREENDGISAKRPNTRSNVSNTPGGPNCWGYSVPTIVDSDAEIPCPTNLELKNLYDQYKDSRTRYFYFREKLQKELSLQPPLDVYGTPVHAASIGRVDLARSVPPPTPLMSILSTPISYPGVQRLSTPSFATPPYPVSNYPGATPSPRVSTPTTTAYPGAAPPSVYTPKSSAYGHQQTPRHYAPIKNEQPMTSYGRPIKREDPMITYGRTPPIYHQHPRNYSTPSYNSSNIPGQR